jgi:hypothetical protein
MKKSKLSIEPVLSIGWTVYEILPNGSKINLLESVGGYYPTKEMVENAIHGRGCEPIISRGKVRK